MHTLAALFALSGVLFAGSALAQVAGRVLAAAGEVSIVRDGRQVPARPGTEVRSGDVLRTAAGSNAQVRLEDSALLALRQNTDFKIEEFKFAGKEDGSERAFFRLLKGGFRTVSGLIGKLNQDNYGVTTDTATVGIRGTHYNLLLCKGDCGEAKDGLYGGVLDGRIAVNNESRLERQFGVGEYFFVADVRSPAQRLISPPDFLRDRLEGQVRGKTDEKVADALKDQARELDLDGGAILNGGVALGGTLALEYRSTEDRSAGPDVRSVLVPNVIPTGTQLGLIGAQFDGETPATTTTSNVSVTLDQQGNLALVSDNQALPPTAQIVQSSVDPSRVIGWGRWEGGSAFMQGSQFVALTRDQSYHFVVGDLTDLATMRNTALVTYSLLGATTPTEARSGGSRGWSVTGGVMQADFVQSTVAGNLGLALDRGNQAATFDFGFTGAATQFGAITGSLVRNSGNVNLCTASCPGSGSVMFAGPQASHAGMVYQFNTGTYEVQGAAVFKR